MEYITMNKKEREQLVVFKKIQDGEITRKEGAARLRISERWLREKYKRYAHEGDVGLVHKNRGKPSRKRWDEKEKDLAIELLKSDWHDFGPTYLAEKLEQYHGITVSKETLRQAMKEAGLWTARTRKIKHRARRERKSMLGMMIQLDGSSHDWFEGRGPKCTLLVFIDDATSRIIWLEFAESESLQGVLSATKKYLEMHGRPESFYVDFGSVFSVNLNNPDREKITEFERALSELKIKLIHAHSPQAKGRVERSNKTLQDRLVKEMRLAGISSIDAANQFIREGKYLPDHNARFAIVAAQAGDAHASIAEFNLENILCIKAERVLTNDYTLSYKNKILQLGRQQQANIYPKNKIAVHEHLDGSLSLHVRNIALNFQEIGLRKPTRLSPVNQVNLQIEEELLCVERQSQSPLAGFQKVESPIFNPAKNGTNHLAENRK